MKHEALVYELLIKYIKYIVAGNEALIKEYKFEGSPLFAKRQKKIPAKGIIETVFGPMSFRFHGNGCEFNFEKIIVDFDYEFGDSTYKIISPYWFYAFINSCYFVIDELKNVDVINEYLLVLQSLGYVKKVDWPMCNVYEVFF